MTPLLALIHSVGVVIVDTTLPRARRNGDVSPVGEGYVSNGECEYDTCHIS